MSAKDSPQPEKKQASDRGWRITLYALLSIFAMAIVLRLASGYFPDWLRWISALPPFMALASFSGLYLWCIESVEARPVLTRFALRCILVMGLVWIILPLFMVFKKSDLGAKRRADVTRIFHELVEEGKLPAPAPADAFTIGSRHGTSFHIKYEDASGTTQLFFVSDDFERFWKFKDMAGQSEIKRPATYLKRK